MYISNYRGDYFSPSLPHRPWPHPSLFQPEFPEYPKYPRTSFYGQNGGHVPILSGLFKTNSPEVSFTTGLPCLSKVTSVPIPPLQPLLQLL